MSKAYLILENGRIFEGESFGAKAETTGEVVFTTGMTGYLETLTDPSYSGQIVVQTFPLIGNYGVIPEDFESEKPHLKGYVVREVCDKPSNFRCGGNLSDFLEKSGITGICGIDTRALTRIVREHGVMNGSIVFDCENLKEKLNTVKNYSVKDPVKLVSAKTAVLTSPFAKYKVALYDFGAKKSIADELIERDCEVHVFSADSSAEDILSIKPDGIMLSNGPGDPKDNVFVIEQLKILAEKKIPIFGICLGHQLLALSQGADTHKLKYGHRGANQPVVETATGKVFITSQNHGYAVSTENLPSNCRVSFINANDSTCEGIEYTDMPAFTVQFHPEASAGPLDTKFLFDKFLELIKEVNFNAVK